MVSYTMAQKRDESALSAARQRFVDSIPQKADDLQATIQKLTLHPEDLGAREDLRRKLHALFASAEVFGLEALSTNVRASLERLDRIQSMTAVPASTVDELERLSTALSELASDFANTTPSYRPVSVYEERGSVAQPLPEPPQILPPQQSMPRVAAFDDNAPTQVDVNPLPAPARKDVPFVDPTAVPEETPAIKPVELETGTASTNTLGEREVLGDVDTQTLTQRLIQELRLGLVDSAIDGTNLKIPLGEGNEVLSIFWSAISKIRTLVTEQSGGRLKFKDTHGAFVITPSDRSNAQESVQINLAQISADLAGKRVMVVDDDPAVLWFFAGLLRQEGIEVDEAGSAKHALSALRRKKSDLIISDILMPGMDGFSFCQELKKDPWLEEIPVVLISWKDDFLQRMRELHADARGYLRKEAGSAQILQKIHDVMRPRLELERKLREKAQVTGVFDADKGIGIVTLLECIVRERPNGKLTVQDLWSVYELTFLGGELQDVSRTAANGGFMRGDAALLHCLGLRAGRYQLMDGPSSQRTSPPSLPFEIALRKCANRLGGVLASVSGAALLQAYRVVLDEDTVDNFIKTSPASIEQLIHRIQRGEGPRLLLLNGETTPQILEKVLRDMGRRGAVKEVRGATGEDRIAAATRALALEYEGPLPPPKSELRPQENMALGMSMPIAQPVASAPTPHNDVRSEPFEEKAASRPRIVSLDQKELISQPDQLSPPFSEPPPARSRASLTSLIPFEDIPLEDIKPLSPPSVLPLRNSDIETLGADVQLPVSQRGWIRWVAAGCILFAIGFVGRTIYRSLQLKPQTEAAPQPVAHEPKAQTVETKSQPAPHVAEGFTRPPDPKDVTLLTSAQRTELSAAEAAGVSIDRQGKLRAVPSDPAKPIAERYSKILIDDKPVAPEAPSWIVPEGSHVITLKQGTSVAFRFVHIKPGMMHTIYLP